jgi:hypothetical protein
MSPEDVAHTALGWLSVVHVNISTYLLRRSFNAVEWVDAAPDFCVEECAI